MPAHAQVTCTGHELLEKARPDTSCFDVKPVSHPSPDGSLRASVLGVDASLYATPDMESRVVIRTADGTTRTSRDFSSPRGANGYYVVNAEWSPDSKFFVFSLSSSGGHSPWSFPIWVYGFKRNFFASATSMIGDRPTVSPDFTFTAPHTLAAKTWRQSGSPEDQVTVTVDLDAAFDKPPPPN